ncbi:MAG: NERD domain-containing [Geobacteraceae bacterium]|nr:MAG: NERD domain-containing [Geobacteraceae bacterium]
MEKRCGKNGEKPHKMVSGRELLLLAVAGIILLLIWLWTGDGTSVAQLGLPAVFVLAVGVRMAVECLERREKPPGKRAGNGERDDPPPPLPEGYAGFRRVSCEGGVVEFVVVGPAGVFVVENGPPNVKVTAEGETLLLDGVPHERDLISRAWRETYRIRDLLKEQTGRSRPVKPVLCFPQASVEVREPVFRVAVIESGHLSDYISRQRVLLSPESVALTAACVETAVAGEGAAVPKRL